MIGQTTLLNQLEILSKNKQLPRFIILSGKKGSGRHLIVKMLKIFTGFELEEVGVKVDDIRDMINRAYVNQVPTIYAVYDADDMSEIAKNAMLKICEEPTNSAFIVMTLLDDNNTLPTIRSRATIYHTEPYTPQQLVEYYVNKFGEDDGMQGVNICETPGQINELHNLGFTEFMNYVDLVFDNVHLVSGSNAFKIGTKLNLKNDDNGKYPLDFFFKAFVIKCMDKLEDNPSMYSYGIKVTSKYLQELRYRSLNKIMLFDAWLLELRRGWLTYATSDT